MAAPSKEAVPVDYIANNLHEETYFGDDKAQQAAIDTLVESMRQSRGKIHLIIGPIRSGKGTVFDEAAGKLLDEVLGIHILDCGLSDFLDAVKTDKRFHNLIRFSTDQDISDLPETVTEARACLAEHPNCSIVIDALMHDAPLSGTLTADGKTFLDSSRKALDVFLGANPDIIPVHTGYNVPQVKTALWDINQTLLKRFSKTGDAIRQQMFYNSPDPTLGRITAALNENNREKYDLAFERMLPTASISTVG